jgi:hypothetical protein
MERQRLLLFHAIQPDDADRADDWASFLTALALAPLPQGARWLAPNVCLVLDDRQHSYLALSRLGHQLGIATRCLPFSAALEWKPLSPHR